MTSLRHLRLGRIPGTIIRLLGICALALMLNTLIGAPAARADGPDITITESATTAKGGLPIRVAPFKGNRLNMTEVTGGLQIELANPAKKADILYTLVIQGFKVVTVQFGGPLQLQGADEGMRLTLHEPNLLEVTTYTPTTSGVLMRPTSLAHGTDTLVVAFYREPDTHRLYYQEEWIRYAHIPKEQQH